MGPALPLGHHSKTETLSGCTDGSVSVKQSHHLFMTPQNKMIKSYEAETNSVSEDLMDFREQNMTVVIVLIICMDMTYLMNWSLLIEILSTLLSSLFVNNYSEILIFLEENGRSEILYST